MIALRLRHLWLLVPAAAVLAFGNAWVPVIGVWAQSYQVKIAPQWHLGMLISAVLLAASCLIPWRESWTPRRRVVAASICLIVGVTVFWFADPERSLRTRIARASEIRVYAMLIPRVVDAPPFATIRDPDVIADLATKLSFAQQPWEVTWWFTAAGDHQLEFLDASGRSLGHISTLDGGKGVMTRFQLGGGRVGFAGQLGHSDHVTSDAFQSAYRRAVLDAFLADPGSDSHPAYCWIVHSLLREKAYPMIVARTRHADARARLTAASWLRWGPGEQCVPALRDLLDDPDPDVRAMAAEGLDLHKAR